MEETSQAQTSFQQKILGKERRVQRWMKDKARPMSTVKMGASRRRAPTGGEMDPELPAMQIRAALFFLPALFSKPIVSARRQPVWRRAISGS
jgi:hypothetical protein